MEQNKILTQNISVLPGIGPAKVRAFDRFGISTLGELILHFPRAYEDRGNIRKLAEAEMAGEREAFILTVSGYPRTHAVRRGMTLVKLNAFDETGSVQITFFNQNYLAEAFLPGQIFRFWGKIERFGDQLTMNSPAFEPYREGGELPALLPLYKLTEGLSQKVVSGAVRAALRLAADGFTDPIPPSVRDEQKLSTYGFAIREIHNPADFPSLEAARRRLAFDELFIYTTGLRLSRRKREQGEAPVCAEIPLEGLLSQLPYKLTGAQERTIGEICRDMSGGSPMSRIVVGDVGCGKTICAAAAVYIAVKNGLQAVLMAPTEVLARQHYNDLSPLFERLGIDCRLLIGSVPAAQKRKIYESAASPDRDSRLNFIIGTQALLSDKLTFAELGLVITDEQHRFGVAQRASLSRRNQGAHMLVMSATPIPRTLALALWGDLEISKIDEMPPGRQRVDTFVVNEGYRTRLNKFIREQISLGGQVYIVCPAAENNNTDDGNGDQEKHPHNQSGTSHLTSAIKSAEALACELKEITFRDLRVEFIHGKLPSAEKSRIMNDFADGLTDILVSTTVIEVGVNVPRATLMIVENAERFGLAQLHQLRGRVGRGDKKSYCVLVASPAGETARFRLEVMKTTYDGYKIAEQDLELRGPGDFLPSGGEVRQHGSIGFRMAGSFGSGELLNEASAAARSVVDDDPNLEKEENHALAEAVASMFEVDFSKLN